MIHWNTSISVQKEGELFVRGQKLADLVSSVTFTEAIFLIIKGVLPKPEEKEMLDSLLVSFLDHGPTVPSAFLPRVAISVGNPMNAALAAGVIAVSDYHGGAVEAAMMMLSQGTIPEGKIPGLGHALYKKVDPRAVAIFKKASDVGIAGINVARMKEIQETHNNTNPGKHLPINIDGAAAAVLCDMGFDWRLGKGLFILGRLPGMIAHAHEEMLNEKPFRRFDEDDVTYTGI